MNDIDLNNGPTTNHFEDHPSFTFYGSEGDLVVSGSLKHTSANRAVRVHFPENNPPPNEPIVDWDSTGPTGNEFADHTSIEVQGDLLHMVWADNRVGEAQIRYVNCDYTVADCTQATDWSTPTAVVDSSTGMNHSAMFPQIAFDGPNKFVVYQFDAGEGQDEWRVMVASQCEGDNAWSVEQVRTPTVGGSGQSVAIGRPSIAIDPDENVVHILFVEFNSYGGLWDFGGATTSDLFWYRNEYTPCP